MPCSGVGEENSPVVAIKGAAAAVSERKVHDVV